MFSLIFLIFGIILFCSFTKKKKRTDMNPPCNLYIVTVFFLLSLPHTQSSSLLPPLPLPCTSKRRKRGKMLLFPLGVITQQLQSWNEQMFVLCLSGDNGQSLQCNRLADAAAVIVSGRVWILSEGVAPVTMLFFHPLCSLHCLRLLVLVASNTGSLSHCSSLKVHNGQKTKGQKGTEDESGVILSVRGQKR